MKLSILKNKLAKTVFLSLLISVIVTMLYFAGFLGTWETKISDALYNPSNTSNEIIIVIIDDKSLQD